MQTDFVFNRKQQVVSLSAENTFLPPKTNLLRSESEDGSPKSNLLLNSQILMNMDHVMKRGRGRPKKEDVKKHSHMFRLNEMDSKQLLRMYKQSEARSMSQFLADKILNNQMKIIEINKSAIDFVMLLSQFFGQMKGIKNNYNQLFNLLVREMGEDKARKMLKIIERPTLDFIRQWKELESIISKLREK